MSEIAALVRLSLARHRWLLALMMSAIALSVGIYLITSTWVPGIRGEQLGTVALMMTLLSAGIASIVLFDYGLDQDLALPDSGCSHWILRMPIRDWKIAAVPVVLKTLWAGLIWGLIVLVARRGDEYFPWLVPFLVFAAILVWIMVLSWRPFRSVWTRGIALIVGGPILYIALVGAFAANFVEDPNWRLLATSASTIAALGLYIGGIWYLIHSTKLARISPGGLIPRQAPSRAIMGDWFLRWDDGDTVKAFRSSKHALMQHEWRKSREWIARIFLLGVIPWILFLTFVVPVNAFGVVLGVVCFVMLAGYSMGQSSASSESAKPLPVYLAASPLSTKDLAWYRQRLPLAVATLTYLCVVFAIAGWACWPSNRASWMRWAEMQALSLGRDGEALQVGIRISAAVILGIGALSLSRIAAFAWAGMTGRTWVTLAAVLVGAMMFLMPLSLGLRWFMRQTDWESTRESALRISAMLPWFVAVALIGKAAAAGIVSLATVRRGLATPRDLMAVALGWLALTVVLGVSFYFLLPYRFATLAWCLSLTALAIPLARILILPLALSWNRHR
jgi:hypothetical protein